MIVRVPPVLIVGDGGETTLLIHEGMTVEDSFLKDGTIPDYRSTDNAEFKIVQTIIKHQLDSGETDKRNKIGNMCMGVSGDTSTRVYRMYTTEKKFTNQQK